MKWSFFQIWNESLEEGRPNKPTLPREKIWASELGGAYVDRYLKMTGVEPSNPFTPRALRKFEAGNIWEAIVGYVLRRAGILIKSQEWLKYQYDGLLPVTGKLDFIAGGKPNYDVAMSVIVKELDWLPEFISRATKLIVKRLIEQYPDGLEHIILEIKSCSSFMFERYEKNESDIKHRLQNFHYLKAKNMPEGHIVYISKDDARMIEVGVFNPSPIENDYKQDITDMTQYLKNKERPPLEKPIVFNGRFSANWRIAYSPYLIYLYNLKTQKEFDDKYKPIVERWNRVVGRINEGKDMTDNNKQVIQEITKYGFNIETIKGGSK